MHGISGTIYPAHKIMLLARSQSLISLASQSPVQVTKGLSAIQIKDVSSDAFEAFLDWVYTGKTDFSSKAAIELVPFCIQYQLFQLLRNCLENMKKDINSKNVLDILNICYIKNNVDSSFLVTVKADLKPLCLQYARNHLVELDIHSIQEKKLHRKIAVDILLNVQKTKVAKPQEEHKAEKTIPLQPSGSSASWSSYRVKDLAERQPTSPRFLKRSQPEINNDQ